MSMIVLCYNQARFVVETLESVKAQTYKNTQLIILDDCSTDDSVAIIERWIRENGIECTFIPHEKNCGICKSLNQALALANGKYISMVASDDIWLPDKIERQVEIMEAQPQNVGVLYSDVFQLDEHGVLTKGLFMERNWDFRGLPQGNVLGALTHGWVPPAPSTLVRRECYTVVGLYDENLPWEDWDFWMRVARRFSFVYSAAPSARYRVHSASITNSNPARMRKELIAIGLKQFRIGGLTASQESTLVDTMLYCAAVLYELRDPQAGEFLSRIGRATGRREAWCIYHSLRLRAAPTVRRVREKVRWLLRNYAWHPLLGVTRGIRRPLGLNSGAARALFKRRV